MEVKQQVDVDQGTADIGNATKPDTDEEKGRGGRGKFRLRRCLPSAGRRWQPCHMRTAARANTSVRTSVARGAMGF